MQRFTKDSWRLIQSPPANGSWNMAVDEAILYAIGREEVPTTLRLYAWEPPCLSIGYAQPISDVNLPALQKHGWHLVRRPTGGRSILHTDELTYAVIGPANEPHLAGGVLDSYRRLAAALLDALHRLHIPAEALENPTIPASKQQQNPSDSLAGKNPVCFEVPSNYEITFDGKKVIGSAQARRKQGVLQHGSLPLYGDLGRITQVLAFPNQEAQIEAAQRLEQRATTVERILGYKLQWQEIADTFIGAFQEILQLELIPDELSQAEIEQAQRLVEEKYAHPQWVERI